MQRAQVIVALMMAACSSAPEALTPSADDPCLAAGHNLAENESDEPITEPGARSRLDARLAASCRDQAWSPELIKCMTESPELEDYEPCRTLMTEQQVDRLEGAWREPEGTVPTEPPAKSPDAVACAAASELGAEIVAATSAHSVDRLIWVAEGDSSAQDFAAAVAAIDRCKPAVLAHRAGESPKVTWTDRPEAAWSANRTGSYSDAPTVESPTLRLWLVAVDDAGGSQLKLGAQRVR